jgi:hypothetical protein
MVCVYFCVCEITIVNTLENRRRRLMEILGIGWIPLFPNLSALLETSHCLGLKVVWQCAIPSFPNSVCSYSPWLSLMRVFPLFCHASPLISRFLQAFPISYKCYSLLNLLLSTALRLQSLVSPSSAISSSGERWALSKRRVRDKTMVESSGHLLWSMTRFSL